MRTAVRHNSKHEGEIIAAVTEVDTGAHSVTRAGDREYLQSLCSVSRYPQRAIELYYTSH